MAVLACCPCACGAGSVGPDVADTVVASDALAADELNQPDVAPREDDTLDEPSDDRTWTTVAAGLTGAATAGWEAPGGDLWVVGTVGHGDVPLLLRRTAGQWSWPWIGVEQDLWAVHGVDDTGAWIAGEGGLLARVDATTGSADIIPTDTGAVLHGLWAASPDELWVVGGARIPGAGPGVLLHVVEGVVSDRVEELPAIVGQGAPMLAVWGAGAADVWFTGEAGVVAHWDGTALEVDVLAGGARISGVAGSLDGAHIVLVGGLGDARSWHHSDAGWVDSTPLHAAHLNGVAVQADGSATAVGLVGTVLEAEPGRGWEHPPAPPVARDWRAVWSSPSGATWLAGGALLSAADEDDGALVCLGPPAACGEVAPLIGPPAPPDRIVAEGTDADAAEQPADVAGVGDLGGGDLSAGDLSGEDLGPTTDAMSPPPPSDGPLALELGVVTEAEGFVPIGDGAVSEIVQGAQGFIHLEVGVRLVAPGLPEPDAFVAANGTVTIDTEEVAFGVIPKLPVTGDGGVFASRLGLPLLLVFANGEADPSPYIGDPPVETMALVCVTVEIDGGVSDSLCRTLSLVDLL